MDRTSQKKKNNILSNVNVLFESSLVSSIEYEIVIIATFCNQPTTSSVCGKSKNVQRDKKRAASSSTLPFSAECMRSKNHKMQIAFSVVSGWIFFIFESQADAAQIKLSIATLHSTSNSLLSRRLMGELKRDDDEIEIDSLTDCFQRFFFWFSLSFFFIFCSVFHRVIFLLHSRIRFRLFDTAINFHELR